MRKLLFFLIITLITISCSRDNGERVFEMLYPNFQFTLPAGLNATTAWAYELRNVSSNLNSYLRENQTDTSAVAAINPVAARISSLDGLDYKFVEEISVRICSNDKSQCTAADEVFYIDDLRGKAGESIKLLPTLRNVKKLLSQERFRLEVVFFLRNTSPYSVESKLDMSFEAVR